jgi:hypothetical protein
VGISWAEEEYVSYLRAERRCFAWVLQRHGGFTPSEAEAAALERYPYETSSDKYRGLIFHHEAWRWAMLRIHGEGYTIEHPELARPSPEYRAFAADEFAAGQDPEHTRNT